MTDWWRMARVLEETNGEPWSGMCYHGSAFGEDIGVFGEISTDFSEHECVWVTPDEDGAEWFAEKDRSGHGTPVVFQMEVSLSNALMIPDISVAAEIMEAFDCSELSECVPFLHADGFDGWVMDNGDYTDVAVFSGEVSTDMVKIMTEEGWTEYMDIYEAEERLGTKSSTEEEE